MTRSKDSSQPLDDEPALPISEEAEEQWQKWKAFSLDAYARYQDTIEQIRRRHPGLTSYDIVERIDGTHGTFAWWWAAASEMRETINSLNAWAVRLHEWQAWNGMLSSYDDEEDKWEVLHHFLEPVAFYCMLQPSSFADRLALTAENMLHQANQRTSPDEPDRLAQDERPGKHLSRSDRRKQLGKLGKRWSKFKAFQQALHALDSDEYSRLTRNYRNLASHSFSPRLMLGHISRATRSIGPSIDMVLQDDGRYRRTEHPTKRAVTYAMGSQDPLSLAEIYKANLAEYQRAKKAIECFIVLVEELCDAIDQKDAGAKPAVNDPAP
ncbi:hypothetical protein [Luteimonas fraxinea]|uniref:hypothetical protein n=1 Tax=Luteimonas fraxinea TaxID=2901869 RepID=UPI001E61EA18|nr:hypothetical protein [Luteimonas fraxinea]MCD9125405.1 hypothetical protein [Luteimonas fraxinea]